MMTTRGSHSVHAERILNASRVFEESDFSDLEDDFAKTLTYSSILLPEMMKSPSLPVIHLFTDGSILIRKNRSVRSPYLMLSGEEALYKFISNLYETDRPYLALITKTLQKMGDSIALNTTDSDDDHNATRLIMTEKEGKKVVSAIFNDCSSSKKEEPTQ
jgi:hypothetical protein